MKFTISTSGDGTVWSQPKLIRDGSLASAMDVVVLAGSDHAAYAFWLEGNGAHPDNTNSIKVRQIRERGATLGEIQSVVQLAATNVIAGNLELVLQTIETSPTSALRAFLGLNKPVVVMKMRIVFRIQLCVLSSLVSTDPALGQASMFELNNYPTRGVDAPVFDAEGVPLGPDYAVELWGAASPNSLVPAFDLASGDRLILSFLGQGYFNSPASMVVPALNFNGGESWLQVRAWDSRLGPTYEEVMALGIGGYGESPLFLADGEDPYQQLPNAPAPLIGLESFSLRPVVPEPSTWTLLATGGLSLFWITRRRRRGLARAVQR